jgi:DNA-binding XRE family transcriptional regulator
MAWIRQEEKKAKKYIREELKKNEDYYHEPLEERVQAAKEQFNALMIRSEEELNNIENERKLLNKYSPLKQKFVTLFTTGNYTKAQLAKICNVSTTAINSWLRDEEVMKAIERYQLEENTIIANSLRALREKALNTMGELMDSQNDLVALNAAKDILDRTGHQAVQKQQVEVNMTYEERINQLINGVDVVEVDSTLVQEEQNKTEGAVNGD